MKKALSIILCVVMLVSTFSAMSVTAGAAKASDLMYVKQSAFVDGEVTYTIYLNKKVSLIGVVNRVIYDPAVLTPVSAEVCGEYGRGYSTSGPVAGTNNAYAIATVNFGGTWKSDSDGTKLMEITFKVADSLGSERPVTDVGFYCVEFNSPTASQKINHDSVNLALIQTVTSSTLDVTNLKSVVTGDGGLKLTWGKTTGAHGYRVYKSTSKGWAKVTDITDGNVTTYTDKTVAHNATAKYTVRAFIKWNGNVVWDSAKGKELSARYIMAPATVKVSGIVNGIKVAWTGVSGATSYKIYKRIINSDGSAEGWVGVKTTDSKARNYSDKSGLTSGKRYQYVVRAVTKNGTSAACRVADMWYYATPSASVSSVEGGIKVKWNKISGATSYKIYRRYKTSEGWKLIKTVAGDTFTYIDNNSATVKTIYYAVRAYGDNGSSGYTSKTIKYVKTPSMKSASNTGSTIKVTWTSVKGVSGYIVYRKAGSATKWTNMGKVKAASYTDKSVKAGTTYTYTVKAYSGSNTSGFDADGITIKRLTTPKLSKVVNTAEGVKFTWGKVTGAQGYKVYRKTAKSGWSCIDTVSTTSFIDSTAVAGTTYYYTVRAYSGSSLSPYNTTGLKIKSN